MCSKGSLVLPQFSESGEASAASSNFLTFSLLLRSGLQLTPLSNAQVWYRPLNQDKTVPLLRDVTHSGHYRVHRSTGHS